MLSVPSPPCSRPSPPPPSTARASSPCGDGPPPGSSTGASFPSVILSLILIAVPVGVAACLVGCAGPGNEEMVLFPLDPQMVQDQDDMTWDDYRPIPGIDWADPGLVPDRGFKIAVVAIDFPDQPFVITLPRGSDPFGNPQIDPIPRDEVPGFYADFFMTPSEVNHGRTINGYWMEQSRGRFGITDVEVFGPYRMPEPRWVYGLNEYGQNESTPDGSRADGRMERDCDSLWALDQGVSPRELRDRYDAVLRIYASYDETGVWQEFGEMKFDTPDDIPPEWGNPNPDRPHWAPTRYVEWTSWLAGAQQWGLSSMRQGENSGTITHELGHFAFRLPDLNNNPYVEPYRRVAAGTWDMMDRGCFNGPGGPHMRWVVPPTQGAAMPAGLMLKNRLETGFVTEDQVLSLSREELARAGPVVARVTARAVEPLPGTFAGIVVRLDGAEPHDRTPPDDPATNPLSPGIPNYDFYSLEVVQRLGNDSFTPDNGVLLAKNKDSLRGRNGGPNEFNSYIWVIDAHPEDMNMVDYVKPGGQEVVRTVADYRQLNDALFHAGLDSGSRFEWVDVPNRLHFYVIDLEENGEGIRSYTLGVRSLDGGGSVERGLGLEGPGAARVRHPNTPVTFTLTNTAPVLMAGGEAVGGETASGEAAGGEAAGGETASGETASGEMADGGQDGQAFPSHPPSQMDILRLSLSAEGEGWSARIKNALVALEPGASREVTVYVSRDPGSGKEGSVTLRATSETDPSVSASATVPVSR